MMSAGEENSHQHVISEPLKSEVATGKKPSKAIVRGGRRGVTDNNLTRQMFTGGFQDLSLDDPLVSRNNDLTDNGPARVVVRRECSDEDRRRQNHPKGHHSFGDASHQERLNTQYDSARTAIFAEERHVVPVKGVREVRDGEGNPRPPPPKRTVLLKRHSKHADDADEFRR